MSELQPLPDGKAAGEKPKTSWPPWKKLGLVAVAVVIIGLAVGLGVGLTRNKGGGSDDSDDSDNSTDSSSSDAASGVNNTSLWKPPVGATWQIILKSPIALDSDNNASALTPDVDIWDLDLYDNPTSTFTALRAAGKHVICYFSAGSWEDWRDDAGDFDKSDLGKNLDGWEGEKWLNVSSENVRSIMKTRIKLAAEKGCHAIDPDNVDGYVSHQPPSPPLPLTTNPPRQTKTASASPPPTPSPTCPSSPPKPPSTTCPRA